MISQKRDWITIAPFGQLWKETPLVLWLLEKTESTRHVWCLKRARAGSWCGGTKSLSAVDCTSLGPVWRLGMGRLCHRLLLVTQLRLASVMPAAAIFTHLSGLCPFGLVVEWSKARGFFESWRNPFSSDSLVSRVWWVDFLFAFFCLFVLFVYFFYHCALQLLVYMRTVEFVCTLINSPLKRFWIHHFLVSLLKLLRQRSFPGWRKSTHCPPPPPGWHKSLPPSARPGRSFVD